MWWFVGIGPDTGCLEAHVYGQYRTLQVLLALFASCDSGPACDVTKKRLEWPVVKSNENNSLNRITQHIHAKVWVIGDYEGCIKYTEVTTKY